MPQSTRALALLLTALTVVSCAPKQENAAISALKKEKNAWEHESDLVAQEAADAVDTSTQKASKELDEIQ